MIEWTHFWVFLLLPAPYLAHRFLPPYRTTRDAVRAPFFKRLTSLTKQEAGSGSVILQRMLSQKIWLILAWVLILATIAKPNWVGEPVEQTKSARDLMIAVDLSGSMGTEDFETKSGDKISRLDAVKQVLAVFAAQRANDRLGLVVFGASPYLQVPFTEDHETWLQLLDETDVAMAGQNTMFGDAIGLAIKLFENSTVERRVLIVLTDGNDNGSRVPPIEAAKVARQKGITIYGIAIGDPETEGDDVLDMETLERVAETTRGLAFNVQDRTTLEAAYSRIDTLEPEAFETLSHRPRHSLHHYPLSVFAFLYLGLFSTMTIRAWTKDRKDDHA
ncbi:vWA domain-containing protein [Pelagicoccus mobilis]|uniref:VWA domain-containing protein n=1 Tax=Pelagicoccus mobilis TaxID=415221 RepID=A0A934S1C9_9BACT|nr:VWA domain-containing protein [Pelagicoccus mobilis]MBK1877308.1 VWA domain-containing protein [Pelagicoccus mobilis]